MKVVHLKAAPYDVRIDRQTHWGNPFVIGKDGNREQVIAKYRTWINEPGQAHMIEYARKVLKGKTLGCWCAPKACHGDVLLEIANDLCPHGMPRAENVCGPCSEGRPNATAPTVTAKP